MTEWESKIMAYCDKDFVSASRIQRLRNGRGSVCVKREDESGFGISGCKRRKYASLIPWLVKENPDKVIIIGGENSNNVVGLLQMFLSFGTPYQLYLKAQKGGTPKGNSALVRLLTDWETVRIVENTEWEGVEILAKTENASGNTIVIPEGGSHRVAIPGLMTLGLDIERNEQEKGLFFEHLFIDSGTGLTAAALAYWNVWSGRDAVVHIVHVAGEELDFLRQFEQCNAFFGTNLKPEKVRHYSPISGKSFGSVNATVMQFVKTLARTEGILTDPVYTAKLFMTAQSVIAEAQLDNAMIIHSGGGTGLMGFL